MYQHNEIHCRRKRPYRICGLTLVAIMAMASVVAGCNYRGASSTPVGKNRKGGAAQGGGAHDGSGGTQRGGGGTYGGRSTQGGGGGGTGSGDESAKKLLEKHFSTNDAALLKNNGDVVKFFEGETLDEAKKVCLWKETFKIGLSHKY